MRGVVLRLSAATLLKITFLHRPCRSDADLDGDDNDDGDDGGGDADDVDDDDGDDDDDSSGAKLQACNLQPDCRPEFCHLHCYLLP